MWHFFAFFWHFFLFSSVLLCVQMKMLRGMMQVYLIIAFWIPPSNKLQRETCKSMGIYYSIFNRIPRVGNFKIYISSIEKSRFSISIMFFFLNMPWYFNSQEFSQIIFHDYFHHIFDIFFHSCCKICKI